MGLSHVLAAIAAATAPAPAAGSTYLAAGDSMTAPFQQVETYPARVATDLRRRQPRLRVRRVGCPGITAAQVVRGGGPCAYAAGSQLATAVADLRARRGKVDLVTLTVGANDVQDCVAQGDTACLRERLPAVVAEVRTIARRLRAAAGRGAALVATTYHDPFLGYWVQGRRDEARASVPVVLAFDRALEKAYRAEGWRVADVATSFRVADTAMTGRIGSEAVPVNVEMTCRLTRACPADPAAFDVHPNAEGFTRIARLVISERAVARR